MQDRNRRSAVEILTADHFTTLANPGVTSRQLLWPGNAPDARVTVTLVTVAPDAGQPRHSHPQSEQVWLVQRGCAELLLAAGATRRIGEGDVIRTPAGETHGLRNVGPEPFVYIAITTPPVDFRPAYAEGR